MTQQQPSSEFSFDLYPGLDAELEAAYIRNVESGNAAPASIATVGLAAAIGNTLQQQRPEASLSEEVERWVSKELGGGFDDGALSRWREYDALMPVPTPELSMQDDPRLAEKYSHLHEAKLAIMATAGNTPEGENAGETMHLLVMPWQAFKDNLERLPQWVKEMRDRQGVATVDDFINSDLADLLKSDTALYRNPIAPHFFATNNTTAPDWLSAKEYLNQRIATDGPWGVMLVQTSKDAGLANFVGKSPDELTDEGLKRFEIAGQKVDSLGIFEWLALTLQERPDELSPQDVSWLLANRMEVGGGPLVPCGRWGDVRVGSGLGWADDQFDVARPRLAVI